MSAAIPHGLLVEQSSQEHNIFAMVGERLQSRADLQR